MSFFVYVIKSQSTEKLYVGQTSDITLRLARHNQEIKGRNNCYTHKNKGPWTLVYKEELMTRSEAIIREKELKSFKGREFIKKLSGALAQG